MVAHIRPRATLALGSTRHKLENARAQNQCVKAPWQCPPRCQLASTTRRGVDRRTQRAVEQHRPMLVEWKRQACCKWQPWATYGWPGTARQSACHTNTSTCAYDKALPRCTVGRGSAARLRPAARHSRLPPPPRLSDGGTDDERAGGLHSDKQFTTASPGAWAGKGRSAS